MAIARRHRTRVGKRNQVTIPAAMLRELGVKPGDPVEISAGEHRVTVTRADDPVSRFMGILWRPDLPVLSDEELEAEIKRASEEGATRRYLRTLPTDHPDVLRYERLTQGGDEGPRGSGERG